MDGRQFVSVIKEVVRESAIKDTIENLEDPPGRHSSESEKSRSEWFNGLTEDERRNVESVIKDAVDEALFGLLSVIDGVRAIENGDDKDRLILIHKSQKEEVLNDPEQIGLHDIYNAND